MLKRNEKSLPIVHSFDHAVFNHNINNKKYLS